MRAVRVEAIASELRCPYCHDELRVEGEWRACATCLARHHAECWGAHGKCGTCGYAHVVLPRRWPRLLGRCVRWGAILLAAVGAVAVFATLIFFGGFVVQRVLDRPSRPAISKEKEEDSKEAAALRAWVNSPVEVATIPSVERRPPPRHDETVRTSSFEVTFTSYCDVVTESAAPSLLAEKPRIRGDTLAIVARGEVSVLEPGTFVLLVTSANARKTRIEIDGVEIPTTVFMNELSATVRLSAGKHEVRIESEQTLRYQLAFDIGRE